MKRLLIFFLCAIALLAQYTYDAYGAVQTAEHLTAAHARLHCGHKALFLDRLDVGVVDAQFNELPRLVPFAHALSQNRNRVYSPALGRFLQRDPNQTAAALIEASSYHGRGMGALSLAFDLDGMYGDGANLYQYLGSNPWTRSDPLGLYYDPFDMVDEFLAEDAGSKAAFLERIIGGAHTAAYLTTYIASWLPIPGVSIAAGIANGLMGVPSELEGTVALQLMNAANYVAVSRMAARMTGAALRTSAQYATRHGTRAVGGANALGAGSLTKRIGSWAGDHHIIPIYMGGVRTGGATQKLTHAQHVEIHRLIDAAGGRYGIPTRNRGAPAVERWLGRNLEIGPVQMRMALIEAYETFDRIHGTNLTAKMYKAIMDQKWLP